MADLGPSIGSIQISKRTSMGGGDSPAPELRSRSGISTERSPTSPTDGSPSSLRYLHPPPYLGPGDTCRELTRDLDCPSMLRTVTAKTVLRGFGRVFRSQGIDSAFALSQECERLGYFISHSWSAAWFSKYVTLSFHFNFWIATIVSFTCITTFLVLGLVYIDHTVWDSIRSSVNPSLIFVGIGFFTFVPALMFGSELVSCVPFNSSRTRCFLDKCCINQTDPVLKRRGIEALGVFLARSDVLLILWSPDYFKRLWCAYEVAVYMSLAPATDRKRRVVMIPLELVSFSFIVFGLDLLIQVVSVNFFFSGDGGLPEWATQLTAAAISAVFATLSYYFAYKWVEDQAFLRKQLAEFSLGTVECSDPSDRPLVLRDIANRYSTLDKSVSAVSHFDLPTRANSVTDPPLADPQRGLSSTSAPLPVLSGALRQSTSAGPNPAGLRAFEEYVRTNLQRPIDRALGTHHCVLPAKFLVAMSLPAMWAAMGLMCYWILKAKGVGDKEELDAEDVSFLICSKLLRAITFYPLLTAALLMYQDVTDSFAKQSLLRQYLRGSVAVLLIGLYVYMFGFHYIFLRELDANVVFYTTLPQVVLFLLIYTRLGALAYRWAKRMRARCREVSREALGRSKPAGSSPDRDPTRASTLDRETRPNTPDVEIGETFPTLSRTDK